MQRRSASIFHFRHAEAVSVHLPRADREKPARAALAGLHSVRQVDNNKAVAVRMGRNVQALKVKIVVLVQKIDDAEIFAVLNYFPFKSSLIFGKQGDIIKVPLEIFLIL